MDRQVEMPASHHLVVTTARGVYVWVEGQCHKIFSSQSDGIVNAKKLQADEELLAVADSHLVILYNYKQGIEQTYKLRREDQVRQLWISLKLPIPNNC